MKDRCLPLLTILALFAAAPVLHAEKTPPTKPSADVFDTQGTDKSTEKERNAFKEAAELTRQQKIARTPRLMLLTEFIEIEQTELTRWLSSPENKTDGPALRQHVQELLRSDKATLLDISLVAAQSGKRCKTESYDFHIYPSEYVPPQSGKESGNRIIPAGLAACECRNVGFTTEADPVLARDGRFIDINLAPQITELAGDTAFGKEESEIRTPKFHTMQTTTQITVAPGDYGFLGTAQPHEPATSKRKNPVVLLFVRADVHHPPKAQAKNPPSKG